MFSRFRHWVNAILDQNDRQKYAERARRLGRRVERCALCNRELLPGEQTYCAPCWTLDGEDVMPRCEDGMPR